MKLRERVCSPLLLCVCVSALCVNEGELAVHVGVYVSVVCVSEMCKNKHPEDSEGSSPPARSLAKQQRFILGFHMITCETRLSAALDPLAVA